jgi:Uma2 family endonuclease
LVFAVTQQLLSDGELFDYEASEAEFEDEFDEEDIVRELDISHLVIEDDTPVDNFQSEVQQRLLVDPLYSSQVLPTPFLAAANVGVFYKLDGDPIVPDAFLSLGVQRAADFSQRRNRSYFVWEFGKVPEVCVEIVSNREGDEIILSQRSRRKGKAQAKKEIYAQIGVSYYVVFDPLQQIQGEMNGALLRVWSRVTNQYVELTPAEGVGVGQSVWLESVGIGLTVWEGQFEEDVQRVWLRWCDRQGTVIPTGAEGQQAERQRADTEQQRADTEQQRAERLAERLRAMGIDPNEV